MADNIHFQNFIQTACLGSFITASKISLHHDAALSANKADPDILALYNAYHPFHVNLDTKYNLWKTQEGFQQGDTEALDQLMEELSSEKAGGWDLAIQIVYNRKTPKYKSLLPNYRKPFQKGKQLERIKAVLQLSTAIGTDTALATVKADIDAFYTRIQTALTAQKESLNQTVVKSDEVQAAVTEMCIAQYASYGGLIKKFSAAPLKASEYFDMALISSSQQSSFTGYIKPEEIRPVAKRTLKADDQVIFTNLTPAVLKLYLAKMKGDAPGTVFVELGKGETTVNASALGDLNKPFLTILNTDTNLIGKFELEIV
jgi:hypothetical protein